MSDNTFFAPGELKQAWNESPGTHFVFCHACGSGKVGTLPPWEPRRPVVWECFACGAKFSVHRVNAPQVRASEISFGGME